MSETVGHSSFTSYGSQHPSPAEKILENALRHIIRARQVNHCKVIAKEALVACGLDPNKKPK